MQQDMIKPDLLASPSAQRTSSISLRLLLVLPFVLQIFVAVGLVGWLSLQNGKQAVHEMADQLIDKSQKLVGQHLDTYLAEPHRINQLNADAIGLGDLNLNDFNHSGRQFWKQMQSFNVSYIGGALPTGEFSGAGRWVKGQGTTIDERSARLGYRNYTYATDRQGNRTKAVKVYGYNPKEENWYPAALKAKKPVWSAVYNWSDTPEILSIDAGYPVYDPQNRLIAILDVSLLLSEISKFLQQVSLSRSGKIFIIERNGNLIASSTKEQPFTLVKGKAERLSVFQSQDLLIRATSKVIQKEIGDFNRINTKKVFDFRLDDRRQFVEVSPWQDKFGLDWLVIMTIPEADFMTQIDANTRTTTILCFAALVGSTIFGLLMSRWVTLPIRRLSRASQAIADGNLDQQISTGSIQELNDLAHSFNGMADKLRQSFNQLEERVQDRTSSLQETEARYRRIFEQASEGIFQTSPEGRYLRANPALAKIYGYESPQALMTHCQNINESLYVEADRRQQFVETIEREGTVSEFISQVRTANGNPIWIVENAHRVCNDEGQLLYYEGTVQDITHRKETEAIVQRQLFAIEAASEGIAVLTGDQFIYLNLAHIKLFGYDTLDELVGKSWKVLYSPTEVQRFEQEIAPVLAKKGYWHGEMLAKRKDGSYFAEELSLTFSENGDLIYVCRDITERRLTQVRLEASKESAEKASRAKSQFLANMSHELRTPLNAIIGFTQLMARDHSLKGENQEFVEIINQSGEHLLGLINDILEMSKIEAGLVVLTENRFDFYRLLKSVETLFKLRSEAKGLQLIFVKADNVPQYIEADEIKLRQILINLLSNALKFTQSGQIQVSVKVAPGEELEYDEPFRLWIEVEDTGAGIAESELGRLFQPFVQTASGRQSQQGTGLGLAISRKFAYLMDGDLTVRSETGVGTTFTLSIQTRCAVPDAIASDPSSRRVIGLVPGQPSYRILAVDDKPNNRRLLVTLLSSLGFQVGEAANGLEAISVWEDWFPHLILMDMRMPEMNGYEATRQIKSRPKGMATPIIALTASALQEERHGMIEAGCDDCVYKPFREEELMAALVKHLHVEFVYEKTTVVPEAPVLESGTGLTAAAIAAVMDQAWLEALRAAARSGDDDLIYPLIAQIPSAHPYLTEGLTKLTEQFAFDQILALT
jgi:PAS domain S-box-containing protein